VSLVKLVRSLTVLLLAIAAPAAGAMEPMTVSARGFAETVADEPERTRELAFDEAAVDAVGQVARGLLPKESAEEGEAAIREALRDRARRFVLTYRIDRMGPGPHPTDPAREGLEIALTATVDAAQVREELRRMGRLDRADAGGPSLVLRVRSAEAEAAPREALLDAFARDLAAALQKAGFTLVDPGLRAPADPRMQGALELGRKVGADVALDVRIAFQPRETQGEAGGGVASAELRAQRTSDGFELALARFDAPGYHRNPDEALLRALDGLLPQIAQSVETQLTRNWAALEPGGGAIVVSLSDVGSLLQVEAVRSSIKSVLGAEQAELVELGPRRATLRVETALSPGALQERLVALYFEGFALAPLESGQGRVDVRVETRTEPAAPRSP
jgi:hypothetical protein